MGMRWRWVVLRRWLAGQREGFDLFRFDAAAAAAAAAAC
jgi:hypothetical protein